MQSQDKQERFRQNIENGPKLVSEEVVAYEENGETVGYTMKQEFKGKIDTTFMIRSGKIDDRLEKRQSTKEEVVDKLKRKSKDKLDEKPQKL